MLHLIQSNINVGGTNFTKIEQQLNISSLRRLAAFQLLFDQDIVAHSL